MARDGPKKSKPTKAPPKRGAKLAKAFRGFARGFGLALAAGVLVLLMARFRLLEAVPWQWSEAFSVYVAAAGVATLLALVLARWRAGKPGLYGAVLAGAAVVLAVFTIPALAWPIA